MTILTGAPTGNRGSARFPTTSNAVGAAGAGPAAYDSVGDVMRPISTAKTRGAKPI